VRQLCNRAAVLDHGDLLYDGEPGDAVRVYREALRSRGLDIPAEADVFAFHLTDGNGDLLYGTNSLIINDGAERTEPGGGEFVFDLEDVPLHTGVYAFDVGIHTPGGLEFDHAQRAVEFQVSNGGADLKSVGRVLIPTKTSHL
jgi:hypothetical protein